MILKVIISYFLRSQAKMSQEKMQDETNNEEGLSAQEEQSCEENEENGSESGDSQILKNRIKELEEQQLRIYADFENTKKRLMREKDQALEYAYEKIAKDLLPSVDTLEIALKTIQENEECNEESFMKMQEGITLTLDNLLKVLAKHGIEPIDVSGEFDPNFHDAIMQVESQTHKSGEIVAQMQKGYKYKERVLRPSMVSIAK